MESIIFIAPPAGGKGTFSNLVKEEYNIPHISTGDLLRGASNDNTETAKEIKQLLAQGSFVSDDIVLSLLKDRISKEDCKNGYILDGFPRNVDQAIAYENILKDLGRNLGVVILLDIDKNTAANRIKNRFSCPECGAVYNSSVLELKPKVDGVCDKCQTNLIHRDDDNEETYAKRYDEYMDKTAPLIEYYKEKNILYVVDSNRDKELVFEDIKKILGN